MQGKFRIFLPSLLCIIYVILAIYDATSVKNGSYIYDDCKRILQHL